MAAPVLAALKGRATDGHPDALKDRATDVAYGFGGRLSAVFPSQVIIDVTELCNLACTHCPHPDFKKSGYYAGRTLDPALAAKAVTEAAEAGRGLVQQVRFTSEGEPLLHRSIFPILADAAARSGTVVSLTTNGVLLTPDRIDRLIDTDIDFVDISIDAFRPETYERIRVRGDLTVTRGNVERLIDRVRRSGSPMRVVVSYIEQPENASETDDFERFWREAGAHDVAVRRLHSAAGAVIPVADLMRRRTAAQDRRPCVYPWERIVLTPRGTLAFCPADWTHGSSLADYRETTIAELWTSDRYDALRRAHLANDYRAHAFCGQCPDWQETRWPGDGACYATLVERMQETR
jgi:MoaA/NifB/PqqE/SkfB family radical SAM enzyme